MLVLYSDTSGIDKYLFPALNNRGWDIDVIPVTYPRYQKYWQLLSTFTPNIKRWKAKFDKKRTFYLKSPSGFIQRTKLCQKQIKKRGNNFDIIFQVSSMFVPSFNGSTERYVLFIDWTRKLSEREYPDWAPIKDAKRREEWFYLEQNTYRRAGLIFATSEYVKKSIINDYGISADKIVVTGYVLALEKLPEEDFKKQYDGKTILFIGFDFQRKGGYVLLEAFKKVRKEIPDARLVIAGPASLDSNTEGVDFKGALLERSEIISLYQQASIFVMPSLCEPFGLVFLEAMAYKLPCIGTNVDAMPEIIKDGKTGFLVPQNDSDALAERIIYLLKDCKLAKEMGESGFYYLRENFTQDKVTEKMDINLRRLLNFSKPTHNQQLNTGVAKNILFYESSSGEGGSANALCNIINNLNRDKFTPIILTTKMGNKIDDTRNAEIIKLRDYSEPAKLNFFSFFLFAIKNYVPEIWHIYFIIKNKKVSLLHINTNAMSGAAIIAAKIAGVPCVCHIRETRKFIKREELFSRLVDRFILLNKDSYEVYGQHVRKDKISIIYDGLDLADFNAINAEDFIREFQLNSEPLVGVAGRIVEGKGQKEFILAGKEVLKSLPKTKFIIVGDAKGSQDNYYKEAKDLIMNEKLNRNIISTGWRNNLKNILSALNVAVLPSTNFPEGLPNVIIEAMALSKPVIATDIPGPRDIVVDGETGFLVPPGDIRAMAEKITYLLNNPELAIKMGEAGRKRVEKLFDIKDRVKDIENIYEELLKN